MDFKLQFSDRKQCESFDFLSDSTHDNYYYYSFGDQNYLFHVATHIIYITFSIYFH